MKKKVSRIVILPETNWYIVVENQGPVTGSQFVSATEQLKTTGKNGTE